LGGATSTDDLPLEMQVLMAFATDPGLRAQSYGQLQAYVPEYLKTMRANPGAVLGYEFHKVIHPGDWRYDSEMLGKAPQTDWADVASIYRDSLKDSPVTITIVGDIDEARAVAAVASTFATLPARPARALRAPGADVTHFPPTGHEFVFEHQGRADQNYSLALWPTTDFYSDTKRQRGLQVLAGVLQNRLYDQLRETEGADYTPQAFSYGDGDLPGFGYLQVAATIKATDDGVFRRTLNTIVADLKAKPPTQDEITRVTAPILQGLENSKKTNGYWFDTMEQVASYPDGRAAALDYADEIKAVDGVTLTALAKAWLKDDTLIHVTVKPAAPIAAKPVMDKSKS
jgi:zinc protease